MSKKLDDLTLEQLKEIILNYETKQEKKKQYNRNYYNTEKGKESIKRSQKKYYLKKKAERQNVTV